VLTPETSCVSNIPQTMGNVQYNNILTRHKSVDAHFEYYEVTKDTK